MFHRIILVVAFIQVLDLNEAIYLQKTKAYFRKDYTYVESTQSFYKYHTVAREWADARKRCNFEGAFLFYPEDDTEAQVVTAYWKGISKDPAIYVGINDLLAKGVFVSIDGRSINDIYHRWLPQEPNDNGGNEDCVVMANDGFLNDDECNKKFPFICKKSLTSFDWNSDCEMPFSGYTYNNELGKCYKFHINPMNWTQAHYMCSSEDSYLAVINSQKEADYLVKLTERTDKNINRNDYLIGHVHLGIHNKFGDGWSSIKGTSVEQTGYSHWGYAQPDNSGGQEVCGGMFYNGHLNDINCDWKCFYICEHDIGILNLGVDQRLDV